MKDITLSPAVFDYLKRKSATSLRFLRSKGYFNYFIKGIDLDFKAANELLKKLYSYSEDNWRFYYASDKCPWKES